MPRAMFVVDLDRQVRLELARPLVVPAAAAEELGSHLAL